MPCAPSAMQLSSSASMRASSSPLAGRSSASIVAKRNVVWPTSAATLSAGCVASTAARYSAIVACLNESAPSSVSGGFDCGVRYGASEMPQLPVTTVVMPCDTLGRHSGSRSTIASSCVCASMKPGAITFARQSITSTSASVSPSGKRPRRPSPSARMRSPCSSTSPGHEGPPEPSTTRPASSNTAFTAWGSLTMRVLLFRH